MSWKFTPPPGHLISGLSVKYYSDVRTWFDCSRVNCDANMNQLNLMVSVPQTLMVDIDTVYVSNPLEPTQIWKPIEYNTGSAQPARLQSNDLFEVKFPTGYFLALVGTLRDPRTGGIYGVSFGTLPFQVPAGGYLPSRDLKSFDIGAGWTFTWGPPSVDNPPGTLQYYYDEFHQTPGVGGIWATSIGGQLSTRDQSNSNGQYMTFASCTFGTIQPNLTIAYPGDRNYKCCFLNQGTCNNYVQKDSQLCQQAISNWCRAHPTEYSCRNGSEQFGNPVRSPPQYRVELLILLVILIIVTAGIITLKTEKYTIRDAAIRS